MRNRIARFLADERGDVPGWVLITLMTAGLVIQANFGCGRLASCRSSGNG